MGVRGAGILLRLHTSQAHTKQTDTRIGVVQQEDAAGSPIIYRKEARHICILLMSSASSDAGNDSTCAVVRDP